MERVYEKDGGYTKEAKAVGVKARNLLRPLIKEEIEAGTPIEVLEYVLLHYTHTEILAQNIDINR